MKKFTLILLSLLLIFVFAGCNAEEQESKTEDKGKESATTETATTETTGTNENEDQKHNHDHEYNPEEPTAEDVCHFCNMKIYTEDEEMGVFTAQAVKEDGTHVYFDDSGCLLNAQRKFNEEYVKEWVRDFNTNEWIEADSAVVVKADVQTPMKYGYAFFKDEEGAKPYLENAALNAALANWDEIDQEAETRYQKKMQKEAEMKNGSMDNQESMDMEM
ncbi:nitrous oxide reductase accessory protein NosL [Bacillus tuaregi]|uniref:nitrous oxide reductase accessory protein NosL n=1 Tax=Bacillus tuaregi TaxID=1816695 RepID=UPI0008F95134|nr:nitrous oxide reductase accessory protein NosL [Bacillus tuaregi]